MNNISIAVLLSGTGSTLQNLIDHIAEGKLLARIVQVVSSKPNVLGIERAQRAGLPVEVMPRKSFPTVEAFSDAVFDRCRHRGAELVCLAGYLQRLRIPPDYVGKVMNIHPSLLPQFGGQGMYGMNVHRAVLAEGATTSGCTVHFVDDEYDHGPMILQRSVPVFPHDTPESLAVRVAEEERIAYPLAIEQFRREKASTHQ